MAVMDGVILNTSDYWSRVGDEAYPMGCDHGGTLTYRPTDVGVELDLAGCAFTPDLAMTGNGTVDDEEGSMTLDVRLPGGRLRYVRDGDGNLSVTGSYRGVPVRLAEAA
jgi:hypothetical protein